MTSDYKMLRAGINSLSDYQRAQEEFELKKAQLKAQATGQDPASVKLANEIQKARASGDTQRLNDLQMSAKLLDRGVVYDQAGNPIAMGGYGQAIGEIQYGKNQGGEIATQQVRSAYEPGRAEDIARREAEVRLQYDPLEEARTEAMKGQAKTAQETLSGFDKSDIGYQSMKTALGGLRNATRDGLDPGVSSVVGFRNPLKGAMPFGYNFGGTEAAGGQAKVNQLRGKAFLEAFESLKGGGAITEKEGEAATAAKARLDQAQSEKDFINALDDFEKEVDSLYQLAQEKRARAQGYMGQINAGNPYATPNPAINMPVDQIQPVLLEDQGSPKKGEIIDGYMYLGGDPGNQKSWKKAR